MHKWGTYVRGDAREGGAIWSSAPRRAAEHALELLEAVSGQIVAHVATWEQSKMDSAGSPERLDLVEDGAMGQAFDGRGHRR